MTAVEWLNFLVVSESKTAKPRVAELDRVRDRRINPVGLGLDPTYKF